MTTPTIYINAVYLCPEQDGVPESILRVLLVRVSPADIVVIDVRAACAWPFSIPRDAFEAMREITLTVVDAHGGPLLTEADLERPEYARHKSQCDHRFQVIRSLVDDPSGEILLDPRPRALINEVASAHHASPANVRKWLRQFWQRGQTHSALIPDYSRCGAPGRARTPPNGAIGPKVGCPNNRVKAGYDDPGIEGINIDLETRERLRKGIVFLNQGMSPTEAYRLTLEQHFYTAFELHNGEVRRVPDANATYPTIAQFRYHTRDARSPTQVAMARERRRYVLTHRPKLGSSSHLADGPAAVYQVDSTIADAYLVSRRDRTQVIGRPILYLLVDMFSRMICGLHIGLRGASWSELRIALLQAFTDKVAHCRSFGLTISTDKWPCVGLPARLMGDRGEPIRKHGDHAVKELRIALDTTAPYRADWKAIVEGKLGFLTHSAMKWVPGWIEKGARSRGDPDYRRDARYTLPEFTARMLTFVLWHNNERPLNNLILPEGFQIPRGGAPTPLELWNWGLQHRSGILRRASEEYLQVHLLPSKQVRPGRNGLRLTRGVHYSCAAGVERGWFTKPQKRSRQPLVDLAYDPRCLSTAYVRSPGGVFEPAHLVGDSAAFDRWTMDEVQDEFVRRANEEERAADVRRAAQVERNHVVRSIDVESKRATVEALRSVGRNAPRVDRIREGRATEEPRASGEALTNAFVVGEAEANPEVRDRQEQTEISRPKVTDAAKPSYKSMLHAALDAGAELSSPVLVSSQAAFPVEQQATQ